MPSILTSEFVQSWSRLWASPGEQREQLCRSMITDDVVASWPGFPEPIRGAEAYAHRLGEVSTRLPDLRLEPTAHAETGDLVFISWRARLTVAGQLIEHQGIDRFRLREGKVCESLIVYDPGPLMRAFAAVTDQPDGGPDGQDDPARTQGGSRR